MGKLDGKVAIVTGATGGIGRVIALELAKEGANVVVVGRNMEVANNVVNEIQAVGVKAIAIKTDVTKFEEVTMMTKSVRDELGDIDILVNNAGGWGDKPPTFLYEKPEDGWDAVIDQNLKSVFNCCRTVIERMIERRSGKIVNIASVAGMMGTAKSSDYCAAKAGVIGFTKALAKEVSSYGINVNCVSPGPIAHEKFRSAISEEQQELFKKFTGLGRLGKPEDIASIVAFLVSDEASFITGQNHAVCGLRNLGGPEVGLIQ